MTALGAAAQELQKPPDFAQNDLRGSAEEVQKAWMAWRTSNKDLEQKVYGVPMAESRERIQTAFSEFLIFLEKRRAYTDAVLHSIETYRPEMEAVSADQIELLGVNLAMLQKKIDALRAMPDWARIRRSVQATRAEILELQDSRRQDVQVDRPLKSAGAASRPVSSIVYGDSERQTRDALQKLWTRYYQVLVDSVEQKPGGSTPLVASTHVPAAVTEAPAAPHPLIGAWTYAEGSQQFNGVAEPKQVILELWMEKGFLVGRYRAQLPDFDGTKQVDLTLRGKLAPGRTQTLEFEAGKIVLQGPGPSGIDLMLVRSVEAGGPVPRGREQLNRR